MMMCLFDGEYLNNLTMLLPRGKGGEKSCVKRVLMGLWLCVNLIEYMNGTRAQI